MDGAQLALLSPEVTALQSPAAAMRALVEMERALGDARTYEEIRRTIAFADVLKRLYASVDEVRRQAERTIVLASERVGQELNAQPVAKGGEHYKTTGTLSGPVVTVAPSLAMQVGSKNRGLRLKKLAAAGRDAVVNVIAQLHKSGKEATVTAVLKVLEIGQRQEQREEVTRAEATPTPA